MSRSIFLNYPKEKAVQLYTTDMPLPELFVQELTRLHESDRPSSCASALVECDKELCPNNYLHTTTNGMFSPCDIM